MSLYYTTSDELTSVADAIRTASGTSASLVYPSGFVSAIASLGKCVTGTFIAAKNSSSSNVGTLTIPYSGSGYPIVSVLYYADGLEAYEENPPSYQLLFFHMIIKYEPNVVPSYTNSDSDLAIVSTLKWRTTSQKTFTNSYTTKSYRQQDAYSSETVNCIFKDNKTLSYYIASTSGLRIGSTYRYVILYSE